MSTSGGQSARAFSCTRCFERKVKCDRQSPCLNCLRSKTDCIFRVPPAPRRRKKQPHGDFLLAHLKDYQHTLRGHGIGTEAPVTLAQAQASSSNRGDQGSFLDHHGSTSSTETVRSTEAFITSDSRQTGQLIVDQGKSRFVENNLWASLSQEVRIYQMSLLPVSNRKKCYSSVGRRK